MAKRYLLGVDLAQNLDYTSFAVIEMERENEVSMYHLVALDRIRGVEYPQIVKMIIAAIEKLSLEKNNDGPHLCMDASGLGAPIRDYLKQASAFRGGKWGKNIYPVVFTGGEKARFDQITGNYNISKSLIVSNFLALMQHRRFDYAKDLQALPLLEQEIAAFKQHLTPSGRTAFEAEAGGHDDLISATCIPLIIGEWIYSVENRPPIILGLVAYY